MRALIVMELKYAWLAGIIEGEGAIGAKYQARGRTNQVRLVVQMADRDIIERVADIWGAKVREVKRHSKFKDHYKTQYATEICGGRADSIIEIIGSLLGERRMEQIQKVREWTPESPHDTQGI